LAVSHSGTHSARGDANVARERVERPGDRGLRIVGQGGDGCADGTHAVLVSHVTAC
jgi:hypothetical protein